MMFDILFTTPDNVRTKACKYKHILINRKENLNNTVDIMTAYTSFKWCDHCKYITDLIQYRSNLHIAAPYSIFILYQKIGQ